MLCVTFLISECCKEGGDGIGICPVGPVVTATLCTTPGSGRRSARGKADVGRGRLSVVIASFSFSLLHSQCHYLGYTGSLIWLGFLKYIFDEQNDDIFQL